MYARLWSDINNVWQYIDYTFTESGAPAPATLASPASGSQFGGSSVSFSWNPGTGVTAYELELGTTGIGSFNLYNSGQVTATSVTVNGLPVAGAKVYARLWSYVSNAWQYIDYTFTEK